MRRPDPPARARIVAALFFAALLASGALGYRDYGVGWDEPVQRVFGQSVYDRVTGNGQLVPLLKYYGPLVDFALVAAEHVLQPNDFRGVYLMRHALGFLLFCLGVFWLYRLATRLFGDARWGLVAAALLVASPRIYADAFVNSKDIPLLVFFTGSMLTLVRLVQRPGWRAAFTHGLMCALAIDTRVVGLMALALTAVVGAFMLAAAPAPRRRELVAMGAFACIVATMGMVALWPLLWDDPARNFLDAVAEASHFPYTIPTLYLGERVLPSQLPWHYIPLWALITTPVPYCVLAGVGTIATARDLVRSGARAVAQAPERLLPFLWLLVPWLVITARHATLYDGWRHLFFVYPALLLLAVAGIRALLKAAERVQPALRLAVAAVVGFAWVSVIVTMASIHPHENVYFNALIDPALARGQFELDYWGLSYREGIEAVLAHDTRSRLKLLVTEDGGRYGSLLLSEAERARLQFVADSRQADYVLTAFRWHPYDYPLPEVFNVTVNGMKIMAVYRTVTP
jgi:hypothetical protein